MPPNGVVTLLYDLSGGGVLNQARWRVLSVTGQSKASWPYAITDTSLGAAVNNYCPSGFTSITQLRLASAAATALSGMCAQEDGAIRVITAYGAGLTILHQSGLSSTANQFYLPSGANIAMNVGGSETFRYDATFQAWFDISKD